MASIATQGRQALGRRELGRREQGKQARREALLDAARRILATSDLSMRRLADEAGVAEATPYNLFGSKRGVIAALYEDQRLRTEERLERRTSDPLERLFAAVDLLVEDLEQQPHFHRALFGAVYRPAGEPGPAVDDPDPGIDFWMRLVADVRAADRFRQDVRVDLYARCLMHLIAGAMLDWAEGRIEARDWGAITRHGVALLTLPIVKEEDRAMLEGALSASTTEQGDRDAMAGSRGRLG